MNRRLAKLYRDVRKAGVACVVGENAAISLSIAHTLQTWRALESAGYVEIQTAPEEDPDFSYLDTWEHLSEQSKERIIERAYHLGVCVVFGRFRLDPESDNWETADSIGDCQGYEDPADWRQNAYVPDIMARTIDALRTALKDRFCGHCGHRAA